MRAMIVICCWLSVLAQRASGQEKYLPPPDTVFILLVNPYRMYWVRGGDTLSQPMHTVSVEAQRWDRDGQHLVVGVRQLQLDVHRRTKVDTFNITSLGVVQKINGHRPGLDERIDLLPRLPGRALESGVIWADTLRSSESGGPRGDALYFVSRTYRVGRLFDSAGTRLAEVSAAGLVRYRDSWWVDSLAGKSVSIDVTGPVTERFRSAFRAGRLLDRSWSMDLKGRGTLPGDRGGTDTTTAGLVSAETERVIVPDRAHRLTRALPGPD